LTNVSGGKLIGYLCEECLNGFDPVAGEGQLSSVKRVQKREKKHGSNGGKEEHFLLRDFKETGKSHETGLVLGRKRRSSLGHEDCKQFTKEEIVRKRMKDRSDDEDPDEKQAMIKSHQRTKNSQKAD
jgi:hypothetical protein